jgi:thiol-disulfide isomerase/thioredoxin
MIILWPGLSNGQASAPLKDISSPPVMVGNIVPDITLHQLINYKDTCANLSDFKGKLIILDFWSVYCKTCIKALSKLDSLQKEFEGKIQIVLITHPSGNNFGIASMKETFTKWARAGLYIPGLPVATSGNENVIAIFPHEYIPHYVWIDAKGRLCAVTSYQLMNKQTILTLLNSH